MGNFSLLLEDDFDYDLCSARLLGRDIATIATRSTMQAVNELLQGETGVQEEYFLVEAMSGRYGSKSFTKNLDLLEALYKGLTEKHRKK
ncbi:hypothetical protein BMR07_12015 [Methylococcaceae bacterium CS1]|uniref:hypothetical protein n=1 Tax=Bathymodiolus platifrons methanotrophic gill symbiont TaxID=113268 RepID=UPI000B4082A3|nr:hypothetical protein [Bathymodiolus platifrons methanotrophic gill symbiont]MCK5870808.1 hypothetical protein [Methyloprofundus sp.]TXK94626.1 hypothetical protein BMR10_12600 [Methylococcaceae bacterium CS4]TXK95746.1 hypothetical protein BMR11_13010 [Methylococcaceae bacterium CS5]TXL04598.1 hypothetical protein BMR09_12135 [Methylococcaceae bacterium CS3]TXL04602.1 hypothetical protein BMR08_16535 [Methylococcaceae bacterium CS2]TXL04623.1 hypothetical protein BMR07_12015 [Methylococcac